MQVNNINSTNFNGYKNVITNGIWASKDEAYHFVSMQLNNTKHNDLEIWKEIQTKFLNIKNPSEVFTFEHFMGYDIENISFGGKLINPSSHAQGSLNELNTLKAFTWLANLTKRLANDNSLTNDKDMGICLVKTVENLMPVFKDDRALATKFVMDSLQSNIYPQKIAWKVNQSISRIMKHYFD